MKFRIVALLVFVVFLKFGFSRILRVSRMHSQRDLVELWTFNCTTCLFFRWSSRQWTLQTFSRRFDQKYERTSEIGIHEQRHPFELWMIHYANRKSIHCSLSIRWYVARLSDEAENGSLTHLQEGHSEWKGWSDSTAGLLRHLGVPVREVDRWQVVPVFGKNSGRSNYSIW